MVRQQQKAGVTSVRRLAAAVLFVAAIVVPVAAGDNTPDHFILGVVPAHGPHLPPGPDGNGPPGPGGLPGPAGHAATAGANLTYHGGPVMRTNKTYTIFWSPGGTAISSNYQSIVNGFFQNVAGASGSSNNVYATDTQYYDGTGAIAYSSQFGGSYVDTSSIPKNPSCLQQFQASGMATPTGCFLDSDLETEVANAVKANGWPNGGNSLFLVFTPKDAGSCWSTSGNVCSYNYYCAYHSDFSTGAGSFLYANMPYMDTSDLLGYQDCSEGQFPNGDWADATLNVASHEHNEAVTDPYGTAWYDAQGNEDGDKCAWTFGSTSGPNGAEYNQVIGSGHYYLQQEWSNATSSCVLSYSPSAPPPTITTLSATSGTPGTAVTITGTNFTGATSVKFGSTNATFTVSPDGSSISTSVPSNATSGPVTVTTPTGSASSSFTVIVPDFGIGLSPTTATVSRGSSATYTVTITGASGFTGSTKLSISLPGGPSAPTASFNPSTVTGNGTSTLTISTRGNTKTGTYNFTVTGTSGSLKHTASGSVTVK
jgi:hypothetical protein